MQKLFFAVPAFILFAGTIFSETTFSPSLDFRSGILMYEAGRSSFFHTARFDADFDSEENAYSLGARYLYGKFPHSVFCGNVHAGLLIFHSPAIFTRSEPVEAHFLFLMKCASSMENRISYCRD
nr:hypothetical protein [Treponema sp.]